MTRHFPISAEEWKHSLVDDLQKPPFQCGAREIADHWEIHSVRLVCARPPLMQDYPELSMRLRGAWGRKLADMPSITQRGHILPPPYEVLFSPLGKWAAGLEIPKPVVIRGWLSGEHLLVDVHLFGWASVYLKQAVSALVSALEEGVSLSLNSRQRVPVEVLEAGEMARGLVDIPEKAGSLSIAFITPVVVRNEGNLLRNPQAIFKSMLRRVSGMARWQGYDLKSEWAEHHAQIDALSFDQHDMSEISWERFSMRRGKEAIPVRGLTGKMAVTGNLTELLPFLMLAETCNTGSHAALGLGWFEVAVYP